MQVLSLIGKLLSGPWRSKFYTAGNAESVSHIEGIDGIRKVTETITHYIDCLMKTLGFT